MCKAIPLFVLLALAAPLHLQGQGSTDLIRGRVTGPDSAPIAGARVSVVSLISQLSRSTTTDSGGRYTVVFPNGGGDYLAHFTMIGFQPVQRQVKRLNDEDLLVADVEMRAAPFVLDNVIVSSRSLPLMGTGDHPDSTGIWDYITGAGMQLNDVGNLYLMAAMLPGVTLVTDADGRPIGISVLGLDADQNVVTVDGVQQNLSDLPTEGMPEARLTTTTSDPSKGGFSGAAVTVQSRPGSWQVTRSLGLTVDEPRLQFSDNVGQQLGREYTNVQLSGQNSGPLIANTLFFRGSFQAGRRTSDRFTILNTGSLALREVGASADSVARLRTALEDLGIPASVTGIPRSQLTDNASLMLRTDFTPPGTQSLNATLNASWRGQSSTSSSPLTVPARGSETTSLSTSFQVNHSFYFPFSILSETKLAVSTASSHSSAYLDLPDARVRIRSDDGEGGTSVANFQLGGNSATPVRSGSIKWEFINSLSWVSKDNAHKVKLGIELRHDASTSREATNRLGTFSFNSLEDFESGVPSDFKRQLTEVRKGADLLTTALSIGDQWRKTKNLLLQYGLRLEIDHYGARPEFNPLVQSTFGVRNNHAPNDVHLIPRFGFTWTYGTAPQIAAFEGAVRGPKATLKGTIGEYRNTPSKSLLQQAMGSTGLPNGIQILSCRGDAAPVPDWLLYLDDPGSIPDQCADGTGSSVFAERQPSVLLFGDGYQPERSWRADIGWSGTALRRYKLSAGAVYSFNFAGTGNVDLNFRDSVHFTLPHELDRAVFVAPSSISSRSGSVATRDSRLSTEFTRVTERRADLRSSSAQLNLSLSPVVVRPRGVRWSVNYVYSHVSELKRGFSGTTVGNPLLREWAPARDAAHQISASMNYDLFGFKLTLAARVASGVHYTPMIRGDVNGDAESNDRAFVFDPAVVQDSAVAEGMRNLIQHAPSGARNCLLRQLGSLASANSCTGPWSSVMNLTLALDPQTFVLPGRTTVSMSFGNPMTGIDLLLNRTPEERSWGQQHNNPDATLLYVRGFDAETRQFRYEVNSAFGDSRASRATQSRPFVVTLKVSSDLSPPMEKQKLRRDIDSWRVGTAPRPSEAALKRQYTEPFTGMFASILRQKDTLGLTTAQADSIEGMTAVYMREIDSIWTPMAQFVSQSQAELDVNSVNRDMQRLRRDSYSLMAAHAQAVKKVLTGEQFSRLPQSYGIYFDEKRMRKMR